MKSSEFITEDGTQQVILTPVSRHELDTIAKWGVESGDEYGRPRYLAAQRLVNRDNRDALSTRDVADYKKLRGVAVSAAGLETMHIDRALQGIEQRVNEDRIDDAIDDDMRNSNTRQARLKAEVEAGMMPTIHNATSTTDPVYTMGDLEALGWMEKEYTHDSEGEVDGWIRYYDGPKPVKVHTTGSPTLRILNPGETLD